MSHVQLFSLVVPGFFVLVSCTKNAADNVDADETPRYITKAEPSIDFSNYSTFTLADSVAVISNDQLVERVRTDYDAAPINSIAAQMQSRGFTRVGHGHRLDRGVATSRLHNDYTDIMDYSDNW